MKSFNKNAIVFGMKDSVLTRDVIFINGISRAGKFFLGKILAGFKNIEYFQYVSVLEHLPYIVRLGGMREDAAIALLRVNVDEHVYNMRIGRNLNFRVDDASSVINSLDEKRYLDNSARNMSDSFNNKVKSSSRIPVFIIHESLPNAKIFFSTFCNIRWLNLIRHPADLAYSWYVRGWGTRFCDDPLSFVPVIEPNRVPWFASSWSEEYKRIHPIDRIIKNICWIIKIGMETYEALSSSEKEKMLFVSYEDLVENTGKEIEKMRTFLKTSLSRRMPMILEREKCPRKISSEERLEKIKKMKKIATKKSFDLLMQISELYENKKFSYQKR